MMYCVYIYIDMMYCIHIYDVMYIVKAQNLGTMGYMYLFIYLLMYVFIFHVNQENWWLQVSSKHFFFLPQEQIISHCQFWDGLKLRTSQRNCGPAAFGLFLCFILGC